LLDTTTYGQLPQTQTHMDPFLFYTWYGMDILGSLGILLKAFHTKPLKVAMIVSSEHFKFLGKLACVSNCR